MSRRSMPVRCLQVVFGMVILTAGAMAQSHPEYISFGSSKGALYRPDEGPKPHIGIVIAHRSVSFMSHIAARELSRRGFMVMAMATRFENNEPNVIFEDIALDVRRGVEFLRSQDGITHVVLFGHSGGGATMSFYQAVAENGPAASKGPNKIVQGDSERLANLAPADAVVLADAHPGVGVNLLRRLDPRVIDESDPFTLDDSLDPLNPEVGYNPNGPSKYTENFKKRYHEAQSARMNRLVDKALSIVKRMESEDYLYRDNDLFLVTQRESGGLRRYDPSISDVTYEPRRLLKDDGTIETRIVERYRPKQSGRRGSAALRGGRLGQRGDSDGRRQLSWRNTRVYTVRSFLSTVAIRSTDSIDRIDWTSTNNSVPNNMSNVNAPTLVVAMGAYSFIRDGEVIFEHTAAEDKEFIIIEGATHDMVPIDRERFPNMTANFFDYVAAWINERF